jgi:hypothetical protein
MIQTWFALYSTKQQGQEAAHAAEVEALAQHRLYFNLEPQGQVELRLGSAALRIGSIVQDCA